MTKPTYEIATVSDIVLKRNDGFVFTTSVLVADRFNKKRKTVIRKIESFPDDEFSRHNFVPSTYVDSRGKKQPMYEITRDGFTMLAMGFTGDEAYQWKIKFIEAFNRMEKHLRNVMKKGWLENRAEAALEYRAMSRTLQEVRKLEGKDTKSHHYMNEAKLVNWALTGEFKKVDRKALDQDSLKVLTELEIYNAVLLGAQHDRDTRKTLLKNRFAELTQKLLDAA